MNRQVWQAIPLLRDWQDGRRPQVSMMNEDKLRVEGLHRRVVYYD
jgi:hypothetical protein